MAATVVNYTRKDPAIQLVKFDTTSVQTMEDIRDWVVDSLSANGSLPAGTTVNLRTSMGGMLSWTQNEGMDWKQVYPGTYVGKDSNGKLFVMTQELIDAFYDPAA